MSGNGIVGEGSSPRYAFRAGSVLADKPESEWPRGIRNQNPGNVTNISGQIWLHQTGVDGENYCVFANAAWGIRAACRIWWAYYYHHGIRTLNGAVTRWAPPPNNPTEKYIRFVADACKVSPMQPLDFCEMALPITKAIILFENGCQPYSLTTLNRGIELAHLL